MVNVLEVDAANWEQEVLKSPILTLVDFWHEHCYWCLWLNPILDEVAEEYKGKIRFAKININRSPENMEKAINYGVMSTPTMIFFCEGKPVETVVGAMPKENLKRKLDDILATHKECVKQSTELKP